MPSDPARALADEVLRVATSELGHHRRETGGRQWSCVACGAKWPCDAGAAADLLREAVATFSAAQAAPREEVHRIAVLPKTDQSGYRGTCSCGWLGTDRVSDEFAYGDALEHERDAAERAAGEDA